jgi:molybdopterin-guanine dinucleotide biosynthesis protein A
MDGDITCIILAGGESSRMKKNKAHLPFGEKNLIDHQLTILKEVFYKIIIVSNDSKLSSIDGVKIIEDKITLKTKSPMIGIYSGLMEAETFHSFVLPCDMPFISKDLIRYMINKKDEGDIIVPYVNGFYEPLHSIYSKRCLDKINMLLEGKSFKITDLYSMVKTKLITAKEILFYDSKLWCFMNINTPRDYERALLINRK